MNQVNLVFIKKDGSTQSFSLPSSVTLLGRRQDCDFCIPLTSVSRKHCEINLDKGKVTVRDLKSRNGTLVNGKPVEEAQLKAGDLLKIGPVELVLQVDGTPASFAAYVPENVMPIVPQAAPYSAQETQEAEFDIDQDLSELDPGRSQTTDFDHGLSGFNLEDDLDLDTEISNL